MFLFLCSWSDFGLPADLKELFVQQRCLLLWRDGLAVRMDYDVHPWGWGWLDDDKNHPETKARTSAPSSAGMTTLKLAEIELQTTRKGITVLRSPYAVHLGSLHYFLTRQKSRCPR
jgi:hypothetical protein